MDYNSYEGYGYEEYSTNDSYGYFVDDYYPENDYEPHKYVITANWEVYIRGHVTLLIALVTIIANFCMLLVFFTRGTRSQTILLLASLAISDVIICVTRIPEAVHFNVNGHYDALYVTYKWCVANHALYILYQICRIISNWITALLGFQRCVSIISPFRFKTICSMRVTIISLVVISVVAVLLNIYEMAAIQITELKIYTTGFYNETMTSGCTRSISESLMEFVGDVDKSNMLFYIFSGLLYRIFPVAILTITTILLAYYLRKRSVASVSRHSIADLKKENQYKRITMIIFAIMIVFLVVEIQDGIAYIIYSIEYSSNEKGKILPEDADIKWDTISSTMSLVGYACNFWILFLMSKQFRTALYDMFVSRLCKSQTNVIFKADDFETASTRDLSSERSKETTEL